MSSFGSVTVPFAQWREACQRQTSQTGKEDLQQEAKRLFSELFSTTSLNVGEVQLTTKSAHKEALAQLLSELGPCFTATHMTRVWALYCLCGAVEGCREISETMLNLLGSFLLTYCAPLEEEDDDGEDTEESVRDAAILCLAALVKSRVEETTASVANQRAQLAQTGVERRCATAEQEEPMDHGYGAPQQDVRGGLSLLPRSRRSLCFDLIRATVTGITTMPSLSGAESSLASFATFSANCLHGESDPRCLMQLLVMIHALQQAFLPHFAARHETFPTVSLFDAVAPYYPIQFTPPPNDKHGITRQGLQHALLVILSCGGYDEPGDRQSMLNLASGIILERVEEDDSSAQDKLEAVQDLTVLLGAPTSLSPESVRELSHALIATHALGTEGVALGKVGPYKALADACRSLVSKVAADLEVDNDLWKVFVKETLQSDASLLATSPQSMRGRSTIAYLACLAASGGPRTLTATLESCLPHLQDALSEKEDEEKVAAAAYGVGAFFSSFEVAFGRAGATSISFHPHPLEPYSSNMLGVLGDLFDTTENEGTRIAVFSAMVSLLMVTPSELLDEEVVQVVTNFVQALCVLVGPTETDQEDLRRIVAKSLGSIIAVAMDENVSGLSSVLRSSEPVRESIRERIFPSLMKSCLETSTLSGGTRFDVLAIAYACENSKNIADRVLDDIMTTLHSKLEAGENEDALGIVEIVAVMLKEGNANARAAFHKTKVDPVELVKIVGHASSDARRPSVRAMKVGMSLLQLPASKSDMVEEMTATDFGYEIVTRFLPAFTVAVPEESLKALFDYMDQILPPLSDWQTVQLSICLPLFSEALKNDDLSDEMKSRLIEMMVPLTEFSLGSKNYARARSDAALCLFLIVSRHQAVQSQDCLSTKAFRETVFPEIQTRLQVLQDPHGSLNSESADAFKDALNLASLLGSAAACRGSSSTQISNDVAKYLIQLALLGETQDPFESSKKVIFASSSQIQIVMELAAASAYGAMISVDAGGPFWKQRLMYLTMKEVIVVSFSHDVEDSMFWGQLALVTQVVACGNVSALSETALTLLADVLVKDLLLMYPRKANDELAHLIATPDVMVLQELVLAGIIKLMGSPTAKMPKYTGALVPAMLRILSRENKSGSKALVLQILCIVCSFENEKAAILTLKPAVESVLLKILDDPSSIFRQMVAETRNYWAVVT